MLNAGFAHAEAVTTPSGADRIAIMSWNIRRCGRAQMNEKPGWALKRRGRAFLWREALVGLRAPDKCSQIVASATKQPT